MKTFRSMKQIKKHYFPKAYAKEREEKKIKKHGIMKVILDNLHKRLKKGN